MNHPDRSDRTTPASPSWRRWTFAAPLEFLVLVLAATSAPGAERPEYRVGDRWTLVDGVYDLIKTEKDAYVFAAGPDRQIQLSKDLVVAKVVKDGILEWELVPPPRLSWPLEPGKWGSFASFLRGRDHRSGVSVRGTWEVRPYQSVEVKAGSLRALPIVYTIETEERASRRNRTVPGRDVWNLTTWYSPDAQQIVKVELAKLDALNFEVAIAGRPAAAPHQAGAGPPGAPQSTAPGPQAPPSPSPGTPMTSPPPAESVTARRENVVPLTVEFRLPEDRSRVTDASSLVAAVVTSGKGVASVDVTVNGAEVFQHSEPTVQKSVVVTVPVKLREGPNAIVLTAREADGTTRQELRTVTFDRPSTAGAGQEGAPRAPLAQERWAVVIGISRYDRSDIPTLHYTVPDADSFYRVLIDQAGFREGNVLLLTDNTERKPTLRNIKWALGTFLARSAKKDDLVVIFYSGHGAPEVDPRGIEPDGLAKYLVPSDADPNDLYSTGLPMDELQTIFDRIEAERVVVFMDSCYSGAAGGRTFASKRTRATRIDSVFLDRLTRSKGRAIITASRAGEVSIELPELGHGIFTHYLVQGLRGTADLDRDGIVSLQELYQYLEQQVSQKSRAVGGNQHPVMKGELEGVLPLVKVGGR
jgi:hypothetical protein